MPWGGKDDDREPVVAAGAARQRRGPSIRSAIRAAILASLLGVLSVQTSTAVASSAALVPLPARVVEREGTFELRDGARIVADRAAAPEARILVRQLAPATGFSLPIRLRSAARVAGGQVSDRRAIRGRIGRAARGEIDLALDPSLAGLGDEGYVLTVTPSSIFLRSSGRAGLFYAIQTLRQLLPPEIYARVWVTGVRWLVPAVEIVDRPRFAWRGAHLDVARHFFPVDAVERYIDRIAAHKMNRFHWHLTDDQGWRIEIRRYPRLTEVGSCRAESQEPFVWDLGVLNWVGSLKIERDGGTIPRDGTPHCGFYTQADVREIVAYARERHVEVVPEIDLPGHSRAALAAYPELGNTGLPLAVATDWAVYEDVLNVEEPTIRFFENVLAEVTRLFPGEFVHVGGDEVPTAQWEASAAARARVRELGLHGVEDLSGYFTGRMAAALIARGRRPAAWNEALGGDPPPETVVTAWTGAAPAVEAAQRGYDVVRAPSSETYFDYPEALSAEDRARLDELAGGPFPADAFLTPIEEVYGFEPVPPELTAAEADHVLGAQGQLWTEYIRDEAELDQRAWPRLSALAEVVWTSRDRRDLEGFLSRLDVHRRRLDAMGILPLGR